MASRHALAQEHCSPYSDPFAVGRLDQGLSERVCERHGLIPWNDSSISAFSKDLPWTGFAACAQNWKSALRGFSQHEQNPS